MNKRIESIDAVRGIASITVINFHILASFLIFYKGNYDQEYDSLWIKFLVESPFKLLWGGIGFLLFFVISGIVLTAMFDRRKVIYKDFLLKRFTRIYVPYFIFMSISIILLVMFQGYNDVTGMSPNYERRWDHYPSLLSIASFLLLMNYDTANVNGVVWTLYHELRIAFVFPIIAFIVLKLKWIKSIFIALLFSFGTMTILFILAYFIGDNILGDVVNNFGDTFFYTYFTFIGAFLYKYKEVYKAYIIEWSNFTKIIITLIGLMLIANKWMYNFVDISDFRLQDIISGIGILILMMLILSSDKIESAATHGLFKFLGRISFSLYLTHIPVIMLCTTLLSSHIGLINSFVVAYILIFPISYLLHKTIEMPSSKAADSLVKRLKE